MFDLIKIASKKYSIVIVEGVFGWQVEGLEKDRKDEERFFEGSLADCEAEFDSIRDHLTAETSASVEEVKRGGAVQRQMLVNYSQEEVQGVRDAIASMPAIPFSIF